VNCRHCQTPTTTSFLDLGSAPPSNAYLTKTTIHQPELWFPLRLSVCTTCWLVQTDDYAGRELLFNEDYAYFSSFSDSWLAHSRAYVAAMVDLFNLDSNSCVVEVAANDGYLLQYVAQQNIPCYGVEPTASTAVAARKKGIDIIERFFGVALATELAAAGRSADLIAANNVLAHVPDIDDFVGGFATLLKPDGVATFEFPHLLEMVASNQFDTAYHEHYSYLSLIAVDRIFSANGLAIFDVETLSTHGGSLRVFAQPVSGPRAITARVEAVLEREMSAGLQTADFYANFQSAAETVKHDFVAFLIDAQKRGWKVAAYGAAAKGNTLMNFSGVRSDLIKYVVDRNPAKQGKFMPGSRIPIVDEDHLRSDMPDLIVILPWNLRSEVLSQLSYACEWGGRFVIAVPKLEIL
jgi:2-polyprenyl-3-methyl-5-hydroxy-6-metoxy-1,4-benzoquinol methylase